MQDKGKIDFAGIFQYCDEYHYGSKRKKISTFDVYQVIMWKKLERMGINGIILVARQSQSSF